MSVKRFPLRPHGQLRHVVIAPLLLLLSITPSLTRAQGLELGPFTLGGALRFNVLDKS